MKRFFIILFFAASCIKLNAQETNDDPIKIIIDLVEEIASANNDEDSEVDFEQLYEQFANLLSNPINLNTATRAELEQLYILSDFQISSILEYIKTSGQMLSIYELSFIHGFDETLASNLYPFVSVTSVEKSYSPKFTDMISRGQNQILARAKQTLEKQAGYRDDYSTQFAGSPLSLYTRYSYKYRDILKWNITTEKDAGEKYFDYISGHIQYDSKKILKRLIVGDFQAQFGQGLVLWNGFGYGKSVTGTVVRKRARGIYGYSSTDENKYFRGVATNLEFKNNINASIFVSSKKRDATIIDSTGTFRTLQTSGLHRTPSEIENKNSVTENAIGGNINYTHENLRVGISALWHNFNSDYVRDVQPYNMFELNKSSNYNYSADAQWSWRRMTLFAETAFDTHTKNASVAGATFNLEQNVQLSLLYRNYAYNYQSMYAQGFGDGSRTENEKGFFAAISLAPIPKTTISGYFDIFSFPWLKYRVNAPSEGYSYALRIEYAPKRDFKMYVNLKQKKNKENYLPANAQIAQATDKYNFHATYNINYNLFGKLKLQNRVEYATFKLENQSREKGFMIFQDAAYSFATIPISMSARYAYFNTDSWNTRIYAYENDVLYAFSIPAYYSKGHRMYFNLKYSPTKRIDLWFRISQTVFNDRDYIGSGVTKIDSNKQTEAKIQMRIKL